MLAVEKPHTMGDWGRLPELPGFLVNPRCHVWVTIRPEGEGWCSVEIVRPNDSRRWILGGQIS